jgi:hypothetical protein
MRGAARSAGALAAGAARGGGWLEQQLRLNVSRGDMDFAWSDKPFFASATDEARRGR